MNPPEEHACETDNASRVEIGRYLLLQKIGEGGMGEVWLAEQKEPVRRRVALKLIKAGMNTREVISRFESERQALALMEHSTIARVFDAGTTSAGAPYFVMEYVAGVPITTYCDNHKLATSARLELFMRVCEGVQHAHQKAIIHRDLKPSNILVTEVDGKPAPKIIDFGVAKALTQKLTPDTMFTRMGALIGTPEYMSPEQAASSGEDIDTRSDVYSLGIVLYELLAGAPPIELRKIAFDEFLRRLREVDAPKPSTLAPGIGGDLDSIALKALEKDRSRRYGSPSDFAADLRRYLNNEVVTATPPSLIYRARKFSRRHRLVIVTSIAFLLVLVGASVISIQQSLRADREAAIANAVNNFLENDVLAQASAAHQSKSAKPDPDLKVRTALDRAAVRIAGQFDKQPEVEAAIRQTIGWTYNDLGVFPEARRQMQRAFDLRRAALGLTDPKTIATENHLGRIAENLGDYAEANRLHSEALEVSRRAFGPEDSTTLSSMSYLATDYADQGKYALAEAMFNKALEARQRVLGPEHPQTLALRNSLALVEVREGKYAAAEALDKEDLEIRTRTLGPEHPSTLDSKHNLANVLRDEGKPAEAEVLDKQVFVIRLRERGPEHPGTLKSMGNLAFDYRDQGRYAEAEALERQVLEIRRRVLGAEHPDTLASTNTLGLIYRDEGNYAQAEGLFKQAAESRRRLLGPNHPDALVSSVNLANTYQLEGKYEQDEALLRKLATENPENPARLNALAWYLVAVPDAGRRRPVEALELARKAVKAAPGVATDYNTLGLAEYLNGHWDDAIAALNRAAALDKGSDPTDFLFLAMAHWKRGDRDEAERFFQQGVDGMNKSAANKRERLMFWSEVAGVLGKSGPVSK